MEVISGCNKLAIADSSANADKAYSIGLAVAESLTGMTFSDVKLKQSDAVVSFKAAQDKIKVRGQEVEYNFDLFFARVTFVSSPHELKANLSYEFARTVPALFEKRINEKECQKCPRCTNERRPCTRKLCFISSRAVCN